MFQNITSAPSNQTLQGLDSAPKEDGTHYLALAICYATLGLIAGLENFMVCLCVSTTKSLWSNSNAFVVSLCLADLVVSLVIVPSAVIDYYTESAVTGYFVAFAVIAAMNNLCAVTYSRYLALISPFKYRVQMTRRNVNAIIIGYGWLFPLLYALLPLAWQANSNYHKIYMIIMVFVLIVTPCLIIILAYARIYMAVRKYITRNRQRSSVGNQTGKRVGSEIKAAKMFSYVFAMFIIGWFPLIYVNVCWIFNQMHLLSAAVDTLSMFTLLLNVIVEPIIYAYFKNDIRRALKKTCAQIVSMCTRGNIKINVELEEFHLVTETSAVSKL